MGLTTGGARTAVLITLILGAATWAQPARAQAEPGLAPTPGAIQAQPPLPNPLTTPTLPPHALPDLIGVSIQFTVTERTTWGDGKPCQLYNVVPTIKNRGPRDAGRFKVQLQRKKNSGSYWEYVEACETCTYDLASGLAAGRSKTLDARAANNCSDNNWNWWRIVVDSGGRVYEGVPGEANNATIEKEYKPPILPRPTAPVRQQQP